MPANSAESDAGREVAGKANRRGADKGGRDKGSGGAAGAGVGCRSASQGEVEEIKALEVSGDAGRNEIRALEGRLHEDEEASHRESR